jgi:crotonobetainyl-CoA:carnitine CoA-transferase CaiB-like acyl-CoA transferase
MAGPLTGLRVLDCSLGTAGPQAGGLLADYGADVTWIEPPGGDPTRRLQPGAVSVFNRGKRGVVLDLTQAEDRERVARLAERADVFIESGRPGAAEAMGLGFAQLHARNPQLVYCSVSGFGDQGRYRDLPPYEPLVHALIGTMAYQAGHREAPIFEALPFASTGAAQLAVVGILAALYRRADDGFGRRVETSLWDGALAFHAMLWGESDASVAAATGSTTDTRAMLSRARNRIITRSFVCGDGLYLGIHTGAVGAFSRLMEVLGLSDRVKPTSGNDMGTPLTPEESEAIEGSIHRVFASQPRAYWVQRMMEADVCAVEHLAPTAAFDEPQTRHNGMVLTLNDPALGPVEQIAPGIRFDGHAPDQPAPAPEPGRDTREVLAALERPDEGSSWSIGLPTAGVRDERPLLAGVKVVDLGAYYAGPFSSRMLADFGADVIKLETTAGDQLRGIERPFFAAQAGKRSLAANLKDAALRPAIEGLIKWADAVHHNMRPGAAERLGLGRDQVRAINPNAIYLYAPGWGASGPQMMRQSFAPMLSGYVGASYEVAGQYNEPMPSVGNEDPGNGMLGAIGLLMALLQRRRTGVAPSCENPQLNAALGMVAHIVRDGAGQAIGAGLLDVLQMGVGALESLYRTADGWLCLAAREDREIEQLQSRLGIEIFSDDRFVTPEARQANRDALADLIGGVFEARSTAEWLEAFSGSGVGLVKPADAGSVHALLNDPEQRQTGRIAEVAHPEKGRVREVARLVRISGAEVPPHRLAPGLGEHTDAILAWLGYRPDVLADLHQRGNIRGPRAAVAAE